MGGGEYSSYRHSNTIHNSNYKTSSVEEIFTNRVMSNDMNPFNVNLRESRDSEEHPNSLAIIIALDVTGSMGYIPKNIITEGLLNLVSNLIERGILDTQVMFMAIGDHKCDNAPLQISQFESSDILMDKWLKETYLEGGGGGNQGESYFLPWYFAGFKTSIDCFEKRKQKGFLFTVGDEAIHRTITKETMKKIFGQGEYEDYEASFLLSNVKKTYIVKHLHLNEGSYKNDPYVIDGWKETMGKDFIIVNNYLEISKIMADTITQEIKNSNPVHPVQNSLDKEEIIL